MSVAMALFNQLCDVGNALEQLRDLYQPTEDEWLWYTEIIARLDAAVDLLVHSNGLGGGDDAP